MALFRDQWIENATLWQLVSFVREVQGLDGLNVEVGVWEGRSTIPLANAAYPQPFHAVDHFEGSFTDGDESGRLAAERNHDIYDVFTRNVAELTRGNVIAHRMAWQEWLPTVTEPIKFAHLDAEHGYEEAHELITAILGKMTLGGIICGDDFHPSWEGTVRAVNELVPGRCVNQFALWYWRVT